MHNDDSFAGWLGHQEPVVTLRSTSSTRLPYTDHNSAAINNQDTIITHLFQGSECSKPCFLSVATVQRCHRDDATGRLLWIYHLPSWVTAPFTDNPCRDFIIELNFGAKETHAQQTETLIRKKVGDAFVPRRVMTREIGLNGTYKLNATVYETVDGVRNLFSFWKSDMGSAEYRQDLTLQFTQTLKHLIREDPNGPALHMPFDFSRWNVVYSQEYHKREPTILCNSKPILALLNNHVPDDDCAVAEVSNDGKSITLRLGDDHASITFTAADMEYLKSNMFLHHKMTHLHDIFVQGSGKNCRVVAVLGWEAAEYCPSGYGLGHRDMMLGKEIKDVLWYHCLRREGLKRWNARNALSQPSQIKLADFVHLLVTYGGRSQLTTEESKGKCNREDWLQNRGFKWKGGRIGWRCTYLDEIKNIWRDRFEFLKGELEFQVRS
ncbi:hypothetical protein NLU13_5804 [Sarocladium strictum]|uniref:Uncharacterized protein n=1 Tax=Sarocladium strictum TaxID=5046 RepID=A0AA39GK50_SARSR|nr:hypothetical protein NLU13_5804 [Sarocladium strictum]